MSFLTSWSFPGSLILNPARALASPSSQAQFPAALLRGDLFLPTDGMISVPVSERVKRELEQLEESRRDTTGCGDNFAGGIILSLATQLQESPGKPCDIMEAVSWGVASGGFACLSMGGAYRENVEGEKRQKVEEYRQSYMQQLRF